MADLISGPINGLTDEERADTTGPSLAQTTTGESLEAAASSAWNSLPTIELYKGASRYDADAAPPSDAEQRSWFPSHVTPFAQPATPPPPPISAEAANAQVKAAGATLTPFSAPVGPTTLQGLISDNLAAQKREDVIQRSAAGIIATPARFGVGALVSLADPINDMAMMVPGLPEAWAARAIESAGGGILARTAVRAGAGAVQGAAGMAALQPLQAVQASQDHEDYSWGDALRQVMFGAALGAGGGALHGVLSRSPETVDATMKAALARVMTDDPRGVDVGAILDRGEADASQVRISDAEVARLNGQSTAPPPAKTGPELALAELDARQAPDADYRDMLSTSTKKELAPGETWRDRAVSYVESTRPEPPSDPAPAARAMATRAMDTSDPELVRTSRANAATIDTAPKLEGVISKDTTEASQMLADKKAEYDSHVAAGRIVESPTLADEGKAETEFGEGAKAYAATCGFGA